MVLLRQLNLTENMKKSLLLTAILTLIIIVSGCTTDIKNQLAGNGASTNVSVDDSINASSNAVGEGDAGNIATSSQNISTAPKKTVQKFYPEDLSPKPSVSNDSRTGSKNSSPSFSVTRELQVKLYLVDKYNPGICYGLPGPVPEQAVTGMIADNPDLVKFLKGKYDLKTNMDIYNKIKQINAIHLSQEKGSYIYEFTDGQCCTLHAYQGRITIIGNNITDTILKQQTQTNPC
jgi:hypothetical protein